MKEHYGTACLTHLLRLKPARWSWWRCVRAMLSVGLPFAVGVTIENIMPWMWIAMGTLMMSTGERSGIDYVSRASSLFCTALLGAAGYFFGYLSHIPFFFTVVVMAIVGFVVSMLSSRGPNWSIGCLQLLLTASIAIGVPSISSFWWPALLYLVGALCYIALLGVEAVFIGFSAKAEANPQTVSTHQVSSAVILSLSLGIAYASHYIVQGSHWFWIPLTVGLIVKPDLGDIFERSILRSLGTVFGVLIATLLLSFISKNILLALAISVLAGILPWCMARSYALQAIVLTPLVLLLVDSISSGLQSSNYSVQRLVDTVIGAIIVIFVGHIVLYVERMLRKS